MSTTITPQQDENINNKENISTPNKLSNKAIIEDSPRAKPKALEDSASVIINQENNTMRDITNSSNNVVTQSPSAQATKNSDQKKSLIKSLTLKLKDAKFFPEKNASPISSQSSNDISHKILNEMLNSESLERLNQPLTKVQNNRLLDQKRERMVNNGQNPSNYFSKASDINESEIQSGMIGAQGYKTKYGFDINDHDDLKKVQDRINEVQKQIKNKTELLQSKRQLSNSNEDRKVDFYKRESAVRLEQSFKMLQTRLKEVLQKKQALKAKFGIDQVKDKLKKMKQEHEKYHFEAQKLNESITKKESDIHNQEMKIQSEFESQIAELESASQQIRDQKIKIHQNLTESNELHDRMLEEKAMLKEDLNGKLLQRAELVAQREEMDEIYEGLKESNKFELDYYSQEMQLKVNVQELSKSLNDLIIEKKKLIPQFEHSMQDVKLLSGKVFELEREVQLISQERTERSQTESKEIEQLEKSIQDKIQSLKIEGMDILFSKLCNQFGSYIEKEILSKQLMMIEQEEARLSEKFDQKNQSIIEHILQIRSKPEEQINQQELNNLLNKQEQLKIQHKLRREAISKWKEDVRDILTEKSDRETESDFEGHQNIVNLMKEKMNTSDINEEDKKDFDGLLQTYLQRIESHEMFVHQKLQDKISLQEQKKQIEETVENAKQAKNNLDQALKRNEEAYNKTLISKKNMEQELNEKKAIVDHHLLKEADNAFNAYLSQQAGTFDAITRTYGQKTAQGIKNEQHKEFIEITKNNQLKRLEKYRSVQQEVKRLEFAVNYNINVVDDVILPGLKKNINRLNESQPKIQALKKQHLSLLETEDEVASQFEIVIRNRENKISQTNENYGTTANLQLLKVKETKMLFDKKIKLLEQEISKHENKIIDWDKAYTQTCLEETQTIKEIQSIQEKLALNYKSNNNIQDPESHALQPLEKEIKILIKQAEDLEIQKIMLEQKFVEQNYLNEDAGGAATNLSSYTSYGGGGYDDKGSGSNESFHDDINRILNFKNADDLVLNHFVNGNGSSKENTGTIDLNEALKNTQNPFEAKQAAAINAINGIMNGNNSNIGNSSSNYSSNSSNGIVNNNANITSTTTTTTTASNVNNTISTNPSNGSYKAQGDESLHNGQKQLELSPIKQKSQTPDNKGYRKLKNAAGGANNNLNGTSELVNMSLDISKISSNSKLLQSGEHVKFLTSLQKNDIQNLIKNEKQQLAAQARSSSIEQNNSAILKDGSSYLKNYKQKKNQNTIAHNSNIFIPQNDPKHYNSFIQTNPVLQNQMKHSQTYIGTSSNGKLRAKSVPKIRTTAATFDNPSTIKNKKNSHHNNNNNNASNNIHSKSQEKKKSALNSVYDNKNTINSSVNYTGMNHQSMINNQIAGENLNLANSSNLNISVLNTSNQFASSNTKHNNEFNDPDTQNFHLKNIHTNNNFLNSMNMPLQQKLQIPQPNPESLNSTLSLGQPKSVTLDIKSLTHMLGQSPAQAHHHQGNMLDQSSYKTPTNNASLFAHNFADMNNSTNNPNNSSTILHNNLDQSLHLNIPPISDIQQQDQSSSLFNNSAFNNLNNNNANQNNGSNNQIITIPGDALSLNINSKGDIQIDANQLLQHLQSSNGPTLMQQLMTPGQNVSGVQQQQTGQVAQNQKPPKPQTMQLPLQQPNINTKYQNVDLKVIAEDQTSYRAACGVSPQQQVFNNNNNPHIEMAQKYSTMNTESTDSDPGPSTLSRYNDNNHPTVGSKGCTIPSNSGAAINIIDTTNEYKQENYYNNNNNPYGSNIQYQQQQTQSLPTQFDTNSSATIRDSNESDVNVFRNYAVLDSKKSPPNKFANQRGRQNGFPHTNEYQHQYSQNGNVRGKSSNQVYQSQTLQSDYDDDNFSYDTRKQKKQSYSKVSSSASFNHLGGNQNKRSKSAENQNNRYSRQNPHQMPPTASNVNNNHDVNTSGFLDNSYLTRSTNNLSTTSIQGGHSRDNSVGSRQKNIFKFKMDDCSLSDINFFEAIKPLLEGNFLFKKFTSQQSLKKAAFDPLIAELNPPEQCGYGMRNFKINRSLDKLEIRYSSKPGIEGTIAVDSILRPVIPQITLDILKVQKRTIGGQQLDGQNRNEMKSLFTTKSKDSQSLSTRIEKYKNCQFYPFSLLLDKGGRVEIVAPNYQAFNEWIQGLNHIVKNKKLLHKLKNKIEAYAI